MTKKLSIFVFGLIVVTLIISCALIDPKYAILGTWRWESGEYWDEFTFNADNTVLFNTSLGYSSKGTYTCTKTHITMYWSTSTLTVEYEKTSGNQIIITIEGETYIYKKQ